ncbi:hypothetical protein RB200_34645 [Streptomyces sp. PmtG]
MGTTLGHAADSAKDGMSEWLTFVGVLLGLGVAYVTIDEFRERRTGRTNANGPKNPRKKGPPRQGGYHGAPRVRRRDRT